MKTQAEVLEKDVESIRIGEAKRKVGETLLGLKGDIVSAQHRLEHAYLRHEEYSKKVNSAKTLHDFLNLHNHF